MPVLIDLDLAPAPAHRPAAVPRRLPVWLAGALLLFLGGAAAPQRAQAVRPVAVVEGVVLATVLTQTQLFTALVRPGSPDEAEVGAVPLTAGAPAWTARVSAPGSEVRLSRSGSVVVVTTEDEVTVLDARSGALRWHDSASVLRVLGDRAVRTEYDDEDGSTTWLDVESGRPLWSSPGAGDFAERDPAGRHLFTMDYDGNAVVRDTADGRVLATRRLEVFPDGERPVVTMAGDRAYLFKGSSLLAVRLSDLKPVWETEAALPYAVQVCGALLCMTDRRGVTGLDPAGGWVRWHAPRWISYADGVASTNEGRTVLLDPATGRVTRELGHGAPAGDLMVRIAEGPTWILGLRTGELLGRMPGVVPFGCVSTGRLLGCRTAGMSFTVWSVGG